MENNMEDNREENKEKKRHGRRKHYRGKNPDNQKKTEQTGSAAGSEKKQEKHEKPDKSEKRDRQGKKERRDRQGRRGKPEDKDAAVRREARDLAEETAPEVKDGKIKHEAAEVIFEFTWADAWGLYGTGYHIVIKDNPEKIYLSWSVDLGYDEIKIGGRLQDFLEDMRKCGLSSWDGRRYTRPGIFDGDTWSVKVNSLRLKCEAQGTNEYPEEWKQFLKCLHENWKIPVSKREQWC